MGGRVLIELPKYVSAFKDRHGKLRYRFRRTGRKSVYCHEQPGRIAALYLLLRGKG